MKIQRVCHKIFFCMDKMVIVLEKPPPRRRRQKPRATKVRIPKPNGVQKKTPTQGERPIPPGESMTVYTRMPVGGAAPNAPKPKQPKPPKADNKMTYRANTTRQTNPKSHRPGKGETKGFRKLFQDLNIKPAALSSSPSSRPSSGPSSPKQQAHETARHAAATLSRPASVFHMNDILGSIGRR